MEPSILSTRSAEHDDSAAVLDEDVAVASRSPARLLISAATQPAVEALARSIHAAGPRALMPFVHVRGSALPIERGVLRTYCITILAAAAGGSVLISAVEDMPGTVQETLIELLAELESAAESFARVRLIAGTTVSLFDRVAAGRFSDHLFYRINIIHIMVGGHGAAVTHARTA